MLAVDELVRSEGVPLPFDDFEAEEQMFGTGRLSATTSSAKNHDPFCSSRKSVF